MMEPGALIDRRALVFERISEQPGIHTRQLARDCGMALSTAKHHVDTLLRTGKLTVLQDGRYKRLFPAGYATPVMDVKSALRRRVPGRVLAVVARGDAWTRRSISLATGISGSTLGGALTHLHRRGVLTRELRGGKFVYRARDRALILELLQAGSEPQASEPDLPTAAP